MYTFVDPLRRAVQLAPDKVGLISGATEITFADLWTRCRKLVGGLKQLGLEPGDRVAILAGNTHQYVEVYAGVPSGGLVIVPLNTRHAAQELFYALHDSAAKVLITDREPGRLRDIVDHVIQLPGDYEQLISNAEEADLGEGVNEKTLAGLFYTGGTTGVSKGVMLSHGNLLSNTLNWLASVRHMEDDRTLVMAPLFHAAGSNGVLAGIWTAGCQILLESFDPVIALDLIEKHSVTFTLGVPTMLASIAEEQLINPRDTSSVKGVAHGGSPIATEVLRRTCEAFPNAELMEVYGATELSPLVTILTHEERLLDDARARSCGKSVIGNSLRILNEAGEEMPGGEVGEVVVRGPNVMQGYWNKLEQTDEVLKNGEYWTGDLGYLDQEGYLFLVDRSKDLIVSGGENVYSTEVEEVLYKHPAVLEAAAFGVPDKKWGEAVHAVVVLRVEHNKVDPKELIEFCRDFIGGYKIPKVIDIRSEPLPKSGPGKVLKRELRAPFWEGQDRGVN